MNLENKISLITTFCKSLLGEITDTLRAAAVRIEGSTIYVSYFFNVDVTEKIIEHYLSADSEVYAPVPKEIFAPTLYEKRIYPDPLPDVGLYVFSRDTLLPKQINPAELINQPLRIRIKISLLQALLGRIPATLKAVRVIETLGIITIIFSLDLNYTQEDVSLLKEVISEFSDDYSDLIIKNDVEVGKVLPQTRGYVFLRYPESLVGECPIDIDH